VKGIELKDKSVRLNPLATHSSQIVNANEFFQSKVQDFPKTFVASHHHFERLYGGEKIRDG
jgi:hypothetical protein